MWISIIQTFFLRVPLAYLMVNMTKSPEYPQGRPEMLFASMLIAWTIGMLITVIFYRKGNWKKKALV